MATLSRLHIADWEILRHVRLLALQSDPSVFGSNYARESAYTPDTWREWLDTPDTAIFGVFDGADIAGMTSISVMRDDATRTAAKLWGSWLRSDLRGHGLSVPMYQVRIDWARAHPTVMRIVVSHRASNAASKHANQKHGFTYTHSTPHTWPDGVEEDHVFYELRVK